MSNEADQTEELGEDDDDTESSIGSTSSSVSSVVKDFDLMSLIKAVKKEFAEKGAGGSSQTVEKRSENKVIDPLPPQACLFSLSVLAVVLQFRLKIRV